MRGPRPPEDGRPARIRPGRGAPSPSTGRPATPAPRARSRRWRWWTRRGRCIPGALRPGSPVGARTSSVRRSTPVTLLVRRQRSSRFGRAVCRLSACRSAGVASSAVSPHRRPCAASVPTGRVPVRGQVRLPSSVSGKRLELRPVVLDALHHGRRNLLGRSRPDAGGVSAPTGPHARVADEARKYGRHPHAGAVEVLAQPLRERAQAELASPSRRSRWARYLPRDSTRCTEVPATALHQGPARACAAASAPGGSRPARGRSPRARSSRALRWREARRRPR